MLLLVGLGIFFWIFKKHRDSSSIYHSPRNTEAATETRDKPSPRHQGEIKEIPSVTSQHGNGDLYDAPEPVRAAAKKP